MITMCDYYGMCDADGRCVGHPVKVTKEYGQMLKGLGEELRLVCSPCIADGISEPLFSEVVRLPHNISIVGNSLLKRIADKIKLFKNIKLSLRNKGTIFFYQVDFFFFLYLKLFYKKTEDRRIVILIYHHKFTGGRMEPLLRRIYESALKKIDGVIYTQKNAAVPHDNSMWMPDFVYQPQVYDEYRQREKSDRIVCLGTMNRYKQIEDLLELWAEDEIHKSAKGEGPNGEEGSLPELIIAGRFDDESRYEMLKRMLPSGVLLRDEVLDYDEYMTLLSESEYCILPYDMEQYKSRTSGVLLESIYCGVIPVAPNTLLGQNELPGIGYDSIKDIRTLLNPADSEDIVGSFDKVYADYGVSSAAQVLSCMLCNNG